MTHYYPQYTDLTAAQLLELIAAVQNEISELDREHLTSSTPTPSPAQQPAPLLHNSTTLLAEIHSIEALVENLQRQLSNTHQNADP